MHDDTKDYLENALNWSSFTAGRLLSAAVTPTDALKIASNLLVAVSIQKLTDHLKVIRT